MQNSQNLPREKAPDSKQGKFLAGVSAAFLLEKRVYRALGFYFYSLQGLGFF